MTAVSASPCEMRSFVPAKRIYEDSIHATAFRAGFVNRFIGWTIRVEHLRQIGRSITVAIQGLL